MDCDDRAFGIIAAAAINNWDKLFPSFPHQLAGNAPSTSGTEKSTGGAGLARTSAQQARLTVPLPPHVVTHRNALKGPSADGVVRAPVELARLSARAPATPTGETYTNIGINNGIIGPVTMGKPEFILSDELIQQVINECAQNKPIMLRAVGGARASQMGSQLKAALERAGFSVQLRNIGILAPPPDRPLTIEPNSSLTVVTLAPAA